MRFFYKIVLFFIVALFGLNLKASSISLTDQVKVSLIASEYDDEGNIVAGVNFDLKEGWKIYWRDAGDTGFPPQFDWTKSSNVKENIEVLWPVSTRSTYDFSGIYTESNEYEGNVVFPVKLKAENAGQDVNLKLSLNYAICKDICIPATAQLQLSIVKNVEFHLNDVQLINSFLNKVPSENGSYGINIQDVKNVPAGKFFVVNVKSDKHKINENSDIFIENNDGFIFYKPVANILDDGEKITFKFPYQLQSKDSSLDGKTFRITFANDDKSVEAFVKGDDISPISQSDLKKLLIKNDVDESYKYTRIYLIIAFAVIGGFVLNFMPCVLPVLSIKLVSIIKHSELSKSEITKSFLTTALGIISSFLLLALIVYLLKTLGVNVGWGFHFQQPLFVLILILILTFFVANMWGFFELRMPFSGSGSLYKKAEEKSFIGNFLTGVLATLLATPCTAPFLGTAIGFAVTNESKYIFIIFLFIGIGLALPYIILSFFPSLIKALPKPGIWMVKLKYVMGVMLLLTIFWLAFVIYGQLGLSALFLSLAISAAILASLYFKNYKFKNIFVILLSVVLLFISVFFEKMDKESNQGGVWQEFDRQKISEYINQGKIVFVDVTADWCLTCKFNKIIVLNSDDVKKLLSQDNIIAMQADWTNENPEISQYLNDNNRAGIPFNIVYSKSSPEGIILPEILNKTKVIEIIENLQ